MDALTTFSDRTELERAARLLERAARLLERAARLLERLGVEHQVVSPEPGYAAVGSPALVLSQLARAAYMDGGGADIVSAGWVDYRLPAERVPETPPREFAEDLLGRVAIVVLATCIADASRLRLIAHFSGDVAEALPYLNGGLLKGS